MKFIKILPSPAELSDAPAKRHYEATCALMTGLGGLLEQNPHERLSLEIVSIKASTTFVVAAPNEFETDICNFLYAAMPNAEISMLDHWSIFDQPGHMAAVSIQFTPSDEVIRSDDFAGTDPLQPLMEVLTGVAPDQRLYIQLLLSAAKPKYSLAARSVMAIGDGLLSLASLALANHKDDSDDEAEDSKADSACFLATLKVTACAGTPSAAEALVKQSAAAFHSLAIPGKTKLRYQSPSRLGPWLKSTMLRRASEHNAFLLTAQEAANLYHAPLKPRAYANLQTIESTRLPIPETLEQDGLLIGFGVYRTRSQPVRLSPADRLRHTYIIGQTGTGKSTLLQSAFLQDMQAGQGCCFIDPHGEAIDWLLPRIPKHRAKDVILFDPSDPQALLGLNLLEWRTPHERDLLIQELIALFYKLFDPGHTGIIGPQFEHWLRNAALTVTEPNIRGTLVDIPRLFTDKAFQQATVARTTHWAARDFWQNQMAGTADFHKSEMLNYFTSKFGSFLGNAVMHEILSQRTSAFDMRTIMDQRKILLVNLSKGKLGSLNSQLLGVLVMTKIQMAAMSRADMAQEQRAPFYVYIDEFQNVVTDSFAQMLSEIRKYGVGLHLAHQYTDQLPEPIRQAITGNVATLIAFRLGHTDASWLAPHFAPLTADDMTNIAPYHFHIRTLSRGQLTTPFTVKSPQVHMTPQPALEQALRQRVRDYVAHRRDVHAASAT